MHNTDLIEGPIPSSGNSPWISANIRSLLLILILLLAAGLRFYKLDAQSFWNDEGNSARLSERTLPLIIEGTASDVHPPLYYLILRGWRGLIGEGEFGLRSFSAFTGFLTVAATISLTQFVLPGRRRTSILIISLFVGLLAALNPTLVYYSQETRMYALLALLSSLSTLTLFCWLKNKGRWPWAVGYLLLSTAGLYTHYFYPVVFVIQGTILLLWLSGRYATLAFDPLKLSTESNWSRIPLKWLLMVGISLIFYLPWIPIFLRQTTGRPPERLPLHSFLWESLRWMTFGETIADKQFVWITVLVICLLVWGAIKKSRLVIIPFSGVLLSVLAMYVAGTTNPALFKFMIVAVPFLLLWLAISLGPFGRSYSVERIFQKIIPLLLILLVFAGMIISLQNLYHNQAFARADYRAMAAEITAADNVNLGVILDAPNQWEVFTYYYHGDNPVYPLPKGQPDPRILEPQLAGIVSSHDRIYALYWGDQQRDPEHVVENWLDKNTFKASEGWVGDVRFVVYSTSKESAEQLSTVDVNFGDQIRLHSVGIAKDRLSPGEIMQVTLSWSAEEPLEDRYKVFLHLVDQDGNIVAQQDSEPVGDMAPTSSWQPEELVVDKHGVVLPEAVPPGKYSLLVGLYKINDPGVRLQILNLAGIQDYVDLGPIVVE